MWEKIIIQIHFSHLGVGVAATSSATLFSTAISVYVKSPQDQLHLTYMAHQSTVVSENFTQLPQSHITVNAPIVTQSHIFLFN